MSPNVITHRKPIQTNVFKPNLGSNSLPEAVWVVIRPLGKLLSRWPRMVSETVKKLKKSKFSKHHQMSPNVIKHRKLIQTTVLKANFASNGLPKPVWVLGHFCPNTGIFLPQHWDISAPTLGQFCPKTGTFLPLRALHVLQTSYW